MDRLMKARKEASGKEEKDFNCDLIDIDFVGPEDILLSSYESLVDRDDVSCMTNPTFSGGMYLREFPEDTSSKNFSEQFQANFQVLNSDSSSTISDDDNVVRRIYSYHL